MKSEYSRKAAGGSVRAVRDQWRPSLKRSYSPKAFAKSEADAYFRRNFIKRLYEALRYFAGLSVSD